MSTNATSRRKRQQSLKPSQNNYLDDGRDDDSNNDTTYYMDVAWYSAHLLWTRPHDIHDVVSHRLAFVCFVYHCCSGQGSHFHDHPIDFNACLWYSNLLCMGMGFSESSHCWGLWLFDYVYWNVVAHGNDSRLDCCIDSELACRVPHVAARRAATYLTFGKSPKLTTSTWTLGKLLSESLTVFPSIGLLRAIE